MRVDGKNSVITGGASGIGRALASALVARGGRVAIVDIDASRADATAADLGDSAFALPCDMRDAVAIAAMIDTAWERMCGIDLVFANAGVSHGAPLLEASIESFDLIHAVNTRAPWLTCVHAARRMIAEGRAGHLCVTASEHSLGLQHLGSGAYTASKHAVLGWGDVLRGELPPTIGISLLFPGLTATNLPHSNSYSGLPPVDPRRVAVMEKVIARGMDPAEVAAIALRGIEDGAFLIPTHGASYPAAKARWDAIDAAFAAYADPTAPEAQEYAVPTVTAEVIAELRATPQP